MAKKSTNRDEARGRFSQRSMLMVLVAWIVSFLCAAGVASTAWSEVSTGYGVGRGALAAAVSALATGILSFLGVLAMLNRLMK
jgi:hypothetical protein